MSQFVDDPKQKYYIDTGGNWALDALFDEDLSKLEPRAFDYLSMFINAYCDPNSRFIGVVPTANRSNHVLPAFYKVLIEENIITQSYAIGEDGLNITNEIMNSQFNEFLKHLAYYKEYILKFVQFHTHPKVSGGYFGATGSKETTPGVHPGVEAFLSDKNRSNIISKMAGTSDLLSLKQAFSIYSRGYTYSCAAIDNNAKYLTTPIRWSSVGYPDELHKKSDFSQIIGGIAASAIKKGDIKDAKDLYRKLNKLKESAKEWKQKVTKIQEDIRDATSDDQRSKKQEELKKIVFKLVAGWTDGVIEDGAKKNLIDISSILWVLILPIANRSGLVADGTFGALIGAGLGTATAGLVNNVLHVCQKEMKIGKIGGRLIRDYVIYDVESFEQSCIQCGAPLKITKVNGVCRLCSKSFV